MNRLSHATAAAAVVLAMLGAAAPANASLPLSERGAGCFNPDAVVDAGMAARGRDGSEQDTRSVSSNELQAIESQTAALLAAEGPPATRVNVPVYFHVMTDSAGNGDVTDQQILDQMDVLNRDFAGLEGIGAANTGFTFTLAGKERIANDSWHLDQNSPKYRRDTRQGGADALNIWLVDFKFLGVATFPWDYKTSNGTDGIRIYYGSLPGGSETNYNEGDTIVHETGHWLGLYHTFQGGCYEKQGGDMVADTPAQGAATSHCPEGNDTCPDMPGLDPIHNYMDYSWDSCYTEFTPGQARRMSDSWAAYRAP
jgi:hypothetical protein